MCLYLCVCLYVCTCLCTKLKWFQALPSQCRCSSTTSFQLLYDKIGRGICSLQERFKESRAIIQLLVFDMTSQIIRLGFSSLSSRPVSGMVHLIWQIVLSGHRLLSHQDPILKHYSSPHMANRWPCCSDLSPLQICNWHILQLYPTRQICVYIYKYVCVCVYRYMNVL